jgi:phosphate transport system permease protein
MNPLDELALSPPITTHDAIRRIVHSHRSRRMLISRVVMSLCGVALALSAVPLVLLLIQLVSRGASQLNATFFTTLPQSPTIMHPTLTGGVSNAIIGTIALTVYASLMAIPLGVATGVYLGESSSRLSASLRVIAQTMAGAPSILMGLFAFSFIVKFLHVGFSAIAGSFALAVLMLPVIAISTELSVRNVPTTLREAGLALGAKPHTISTKIVIPSALSGIVTGCMLAIARAVGETAPVLLTIGGGYLNQWRPLNPVSSLPLTIFVNAKSEWPAERAQVWGIALVLVLFVFVISLSARIWAAKKQKRNS